MCCAEQTKNLKRTGEVGISSNAFFLVDICKRHGR